MKYAGLLLLSLIFITSKIHAQEKTNPSTAQDDSLYLNIVIPEQGTVVYSYSRYRVAANTNPGAKAFINGKEVKVYSSGAFVDMIQPVADTTEIEFMVSMNRQTITKKMYLVKPQITPFKLEGKVITDKMVRPTDDIWLETGEKLNVQFLGSPGEEVVFNIDGFKRNIPMEEVPAELTGGLKGLYRGSYEVKSGDRVKDRNITFKMKKNFISYHKKTTDFTVSFNGVPRVGEVNTDDAYLNIGMGTDRLGGARYGFIDEGVRLNITGMKDDNYKVRLSKSLDAWIPVRFVDVLNEQVSPVESLTGNINISGGEKEDIITLNLSQKLPYTSYQELNPNKIIVDVYGATSNTNWKTKHLNSLGIRQVEWRQLENDRYRLIIELEHSQNWGYSVGYEWGSQLMIKVKRPPIIKNIQNPLEGRTITVDAGHGGDNQGALGAAGYKEKEITLQIAEKLNSLLREYKVNVVMTRTRDTTMYMSTRKEIALSNNTDILVSIHANSIGYVSDPVQMKGTGAFYKHMAYKPLAETMYRKMMELGFNDYGLTGSFNFSLNAPTDYPNVLVETAFLSNPEEEILLTDPDFQRKIAKQIVQGLKEFYLNHAYLETVSDMPEK